MALFHSGHKHKETQKPTGESLLELPPMDLPSPLLAHAEHSDSDNYQNYNILLILRSSHGHYPIGAPSIPVFAVGVRVNQKVVKIIVCALRLAGPIRQTAQRSNGSL